MNYLHSCIMLNKILSSDEPSGIQSSLISNMYNYILMNIAHCLVILLETNQKLNSLVT